MEKFGVKKIAIIGVGRLGSVFARILNELGYPLILIDKNSEGLNTLKKELTSKSNSIIHTSDKTSDVSDASLIIISVKPTYVQEVVRELKTNSFDKLIVSCAAGIPIAKLENWGGKKLIRIMPNICAEVKEAVIAYSKNKNIREQEIKDFLSVFKSLGNCIEVDEKLLDPITAASGSGPAFIAYFADAMIKESIKEGVDMQTANSIVAQTLIGVGRMMQKNWSSEKIMQTVASPGGTTEAGLKMLDQGQIKTTIANAMNQATQKARELGK